MSKKPFNFTFSNRVWEVSFPTLIADDPQCVGYTDPMAGTLEVRKDQLGKQLIEVFYHELSHVILARCEGLIPNAEELICNLMAEGLTTIIPQLPKYLR